MPDSPQSDLMRLLKDERAALVTGQFSDVIAQSDLKLALLGRVEKSDIPPVELTPVLAALSENQTLLAACLDGVRQAQARLSELAKVRDGLTVYHQDGRADQIKSARPALERKA